MRRVMKQPTKGELRRELATAKKAAVDAIQAFNEHRAADVRWQWVTATAGVLGGVLIGWVAL